MLDLSAYFAAINVGNNFVVTENSSKNSDIHNTDFLSGIRQKCRGRF